MKTIVKDDMGREVPTEQFGDDPESSELDHDFLAGYEQENATPPEAEGDKDDPGGRVQEDKSEESATGTQEAEDTDEGEGEPDDDDEPVTITKGKLRRLEDVADALEGLKASDVKKEFQQVFGHYGEVNKGLKKANRLLADLKELAAQGGFSESDLAHMKDTMPEIAEPLLEATKRNRERTQAAIASSQAKDEAESRQEQEESVRKTEAARASYEDNMATLDARYPEWRDLTDYSKASSKGFYQWLSSQPEAYQKQVNNTESPAVVLGVMGRYEKHLEQQERQASNSGQGQRRAGALRRAQVPRGDRPRPPARKMTPQEELRAGYEGNI